MALVDHFRELRARLLISVLAIVVATIASFFLDQLLELVTGPYNDAKDMLRGDTRTIIFVSGVGGGLSIQLKLCAVSGLVLSSPVWLYQVWGFVLPGLHRNERRWTIVFVSIAGPLFLAGVALGYYVLPKGLQDLISFTPADMTNLDDFNDFFTFEIRMLLVFGLSLEIPFFAVLLNLAGIVSGKALGRYRPWIVLGRSSSPPSRPRRPTRSPCCCWPYRCWLCSSCRRSSRAWSTGAGAVARAAPTRGLTTRPRRYSKAAV